MSHLFVSDAPNTVTSASASVLPVNIQGRSLLRLSGLIFLLSKGLSGVFSNTTVQKHQFFISQLSSQSIPMEKKCKKAKWLSGEALQIAVERREVKSKGEKERHYFVNKGPSSQGYGFSSVYVWM